MLRGKEEVMVLMQQSPVQSNEGLPLLIGQFTCCLRLRGTNLDALLLHYDQASIYAFDFIHKLFLTDRPSLGLTKHTNLLIRRRYVIGGCRSHVTLVSPLSILQGGKVQLG